MPAVLKFNHVRLVEARRAARVSREAVAASLGITYKTVYRFETGRREPSFTQAAHMAELCNVDLRELVA